jgi:hypothetical protein
MITTTDGMSEAINRPDQRAKKSLALMDVRGKFTNDVECYFEGTKICHDL